MEEKDAIYVPLSHVFLNTNAPPAPALLNSYPSHVVLFFLVDVENENVSICLMRIFNNLQKRLIQLRLQVDYEKKTYM